MAVGAPESALQLRSQEVQASRQGAAESAGCEALPARRQAACCGDAARTGYSIGLGYASANPQSFCRKSIIARKNSS